MIFFQNACHVLKKDDFWASCWMVGKPPPNCHFFFPQGVSEIRLSRPKGWLPSKIANGMRIIFSKYIGLTPLWQFLDGNSGLEFELWRKTLIRRICFFFLALVRMFR